MNIKPSLVCIILISAITFACQKGGSEKEIPVDGLSKSDLKGEWKVQWVTTPEEGKTVDPSVNYTMNGAMIFEDSKLTINAYGYEGCIFGTDTLSHSLNWKIQSDTLNLVNEGDPFGIPYIIKEASSKKIKLQLVEDVFLFLTK